MELERQVRQLEKNNELLMSHIQQEQAKSAHLQMMLKEVDTYMHTT